MSNHVWECPHGVEMGQGASKWCPKCDAEREQRRHAEQVRVEAIWAAFRDWERSGDWHDLLAGIASIARRARELEQA